jgi:hypothetical protein
LHRGTAVVTHSLIAELAKSRKEVRTKTQTAKATSVVRAAVPLTGLADLNALGA